MNIKIRSSRLIAMLVLASVSFSGCASMMQAGCNPDQAYDIGSSDAKSGTRMVSARWDVCQVPAEKLAEIKAAYRKGYENASGVSAAAPASPTTININLVGQGQ